MARTIIETERARVSRTAEPARGTTCAWCGSPPRQTGKRAATLFRYTVERLDPLGAARVHPFDRHSSAQLFCSRSCWSAFHG